MWDQPTSKEEGKAVLGGSAAVCSLDGGLEHLVVLMSFPLPLTLPPPVPALGGIPTTCLAAGDALGTARRLAPLSGGLPCPWGARGPPEGRY